MTHPVWKGPWVVRRARGSTTYDVRWKGPPGEDGVTKTHSRPLGRFGTREEAERAAEVACAEHGLAIAPPGHPHHPPEPGGATKPITFRLRAQAELRWADLQREAADQARAEAAAKEAKARATFRDLQGKLRGARRAEQQLAELLPPHLVERLDSRRKQLVECRALIERARRNGKSAEHLEAALEHAEIAWKTTRKAIG